MKTKVVVVVVVVAAAVVVNVFEDFCFVCLLFLGTSKITELHIEAQVHQDVRPLNVPVHHRWVPAMKIIHPLEDAFRALLEQRPLQCSELLEQSAHGTARHIFQVDVEAVIGACEAQAGHDVGMSQVLAD